MLPGGSKEMNTINGPTGLPYLSVTDNKDTVKLQLHAYDDVGPYYLTIDKRALPDLIRTLEQYEGY